MAARLLKTVSSPPPERCDVVSGGSSTSVQPRGGAVTNRGSAVTGTLSAHAVRIGCISAANSCCACIDVSASPDRSPSWELVSSQND
jgi:hypothetical protein